MEDREENKDSYKYYNMIKPNGNFYTATRLIFNTKALSLLPLLLIYQIEKLYKIKI